MKKIIAFLFLSVLVLWFASEVLAATKWYEGGTLQAATREEWINATYANRLASSAQFVAEGFVGGKIVKEKGWDALKPRSVRFEKHMMDILSGSKYKNIDVSEAAIMCENVLILEDMK